MSLITLRNLLKILIFKNERGTLTQEEYLKMFNLARKNKLLDLYLDHLPEAIKDHVYIKEIINKRRRQEEAWHRTLTETIKVLNEIGVKYAVFKTLKSFHFLPNDIDILIFDERSLEYAKVTLVSMGYKLGKPEPYVVSLNSPHGIEVELHKNLSVSYIVYLDKSVLKPYVTIKNINGISALTLDPIAELLCTIAHSIFKENMIVLADFIDMKFRLHQIKDLKSFKELAITSKMEEVAYLALKIAAFLENIIDGEEVFNFLLNEWPKVNYKGIMDAYLHRLMAKPNFPHKLHPTILALLFIEQARKSIATRLSLKDQLFNLLNVRNPHTKMLSKLIVSRIKRESY
jgi:hypothetical protein